MTCAELSLDTRLTQDFFPKESLPPRPINEDTIVAPWLAVEGDEPVRTLSCCIGTPVLISCLILAYTPAEADEIWLSP